MTRAIDPLFSALLARFGGRTRAHPAKSKPDGQPMSPANSRYESRPRWDAPAHWVEAERNWWQ